MTLDLTPTERRIYDKLSDGYEHSIREVACCISDDGIVETATVYRHISTLRSKLEAVGIGVVAHSGNYRLYAKSVQISLP